MYRPPPVGFPGWPPAPPMMCLPGAPPPALCYSMPPPGFPVPPPNTGWNTSGLPPMSGFPPVPFSACLAPPVRPMAPVVAPPGGLPNLQGGLHHRAMFPPRGLPPPAVPFPVSLPPPAGLPPVAIGMPLPPIPPPNYPPPPSGTFTRFRGQPPSPSVHRAACAPGPGVGLHRGAGNSASSGMRHNRPNGQWTNKRKADETFKKQPADKRQKVDKRDLPENNVFACEACDRGFKTEDLYKTHVDSHEKCRVPGCEYTAHPKLVKIHYDCQHRTGLAKKIWQKESKEDVDSWISDRKKNYPTKENFEKKKLHLEERRKRGEVLENKHFGKFGRAGRGRRGRFNGRDYCRENEAEDAEIKEQESTDLNTSVNKSIAEEGEKGTEEENGELAMEENDGSYKVSDSNEVLSQSSRKLRKSEKFRKKSQMDVDNPLKNIALRRKKNHTLLEGLLANEIRHERNVLLQCVRYVINKFCLSEEHSRTDTNETAVLTETTMPEVVAA